jgi:hypothetical protein
MIYDIKDKSDGRNAIFEFLCNRKFKSVVDVGGGLNIWASPYVTHCIDINQPKKYECKFLKADISTQRDWDNIRSIVAFTGKFDFSICTHVLEDIANPSLVLQMLPQISHMGFVSFPSKHAEICRGIECGTPEDQAAWGIGGGKYRGYFHHRWILTILDYKLRLFPKLNFIEYINGLEWATRENKDAHFHELSFWWKDDIPFEIFNDDFMGPDGGTYMKAWRTEIIKGY